MPTELYTAIDVALRAKCSTDAVQRWARAGRLVPIARTPSGTKLFDPADVERFVQERDREHAAA